MNTNETKIVKVEIFDPALKAHYGPTMKIGLHNAIVGEQKGKWRIIREEEKPQNQIYETRVMEPVRPNALTLGEFLKTATKRLKKKSVAWLQDHSRTGGAELSNAEAIRIGRDCGFNILLGTPANRIEEIAGILEKADVIVLNNLFEFLPSTMRLILEKIFSERVPYVKYEHDHRELGRIDFSRRLFQNSALNVFLSPIHLANHQKALGCKGICLPLAIDPRPFLVGRNDHRQAATAAVCNVRHFKTWGNLEKYIKEHPEISFTVYADKAMVQGPNVKTVSLVPYEKMPGEYAKYEYLVHLLDGWGAGERVIFEAALSGCKVVSNERAGHMSWGRDLTDKDGLAKWLIEAPFLFWREIDRIGG